MSEAIPLHPDVMACDLAITTIEQLILERTVEEGILASHGLYVAYEQALKDRYPYKHIK